LNQIFTLLDDIGRHDVVVMLGRNFKLYSLNTIAANESHLGMLGGLRENHVGLVKLQTDEPLDL